MALIAALLPKEADRSALGAATQAHRLAWARSWRELDQLVKREPVAAAVADLHAERGKDGVLRVYRFARRFPLTPIVAWGDLDGRDLYRLGKAGASEVVVSQESSNATLVADVLGNATSDLLAAEIDARLRHRLSEEARRLVQSAASRIPTGVQVPDLAAANGMSVSTLERRCERWGLPTPGQLLLWLRIVYGLKWLLEPGRSVESVARQLDYSSGAAFRRAIKVTVGGKPTPLRNRHGLESALEAFVASCPGDRPGDLTNLAGRGS
jgi:AraC-like DNA-binding protein